MLTAHRRPQLDPADQRTCCTRCRRGSPTSVLVDWANLAAQCPGDCFYDDGIHINQNGQNYYSQLIFDALGI